MTSPLLFLVGATHRTAPFGFREKLAICVEAEASLAAELRRIRTVSEFLVLNTCNRIEIYGVATDVNAARKSVEAFCVLRQVDPVDFDRFGFVHVGRPVVQHLLDVASGLDSQMLGETEIFGQVKRAYATAQARASLGPILNRLFQKAFQAAKYVRTNTRISAGQVSVANVAVDLAAAVFGDLSATKILLIGSGEMAEKSARAFVSRGARHVSVTSRHLDHAERLAGTLGGTTVAYASREERLAEFDIVVCSTSAPSTVVSASSARQAMDVRVTRPLLFVDLAMPRDVDPAVTQIGNVFLYNLDDLAEVAARNRHARASHAAAGRAALEPRIAALWSMLEYQLTTMAGADSASGVLAPAVAA